MRDWRDKFEEPTECLDCKAQFESETAPLGSLDYYEYEAKYMDKFCPNCGGDNLRFHAPAEDRQR